MKEQNDNEKREWKLVYIENEDGKEGRKIHIYNPSSYTTFSWEDSEYIKIGLDSLILPV